MKKLEQRLDNVVYRAGIGQSRDQSRQLVNHGHIMVNGEKVSVASYQVSTGDIVSIREGSAKGKYFSALAPQWLKAYQPPAWLALDPVALRVTVQGVPTITDSGVDIADLHSLVEYYSR